MRARMLVFVQQLQYYCTLEVIEPKWQSLMAQVNSDGKSADGNKVPNRTVDQLMQDHLDFLDGCLKDCMLTQKRLLKVKPNGPLTPTMPLTSCCS